ncbi:unnamed protein product [Urochloa humidicola]
MVTSKAWEFFKTTDKIQFYIPNKCLPEHSIQQELLHAFPLPANSPFCSPTKTSVIIKDISSEKQQASTPVQPLTPQGLPPPANKGKRIVQDIVVDTDVRRSTRVRKMKKGFRTNECLDKFCLGCEVSPPNISPSVIKNLGTAFCKLDAEKLTLDKLRAKRKADPINKTAKPKQGDPLEEIKTAVKRTATLKKPIKGKKPPVANDDDKPNKDKNKEEIKKPRKH